MDKNITIHKISKNLMDKIKIRKSLLPIFESFNVWLLNENVSAAKTYMQKMYAKAHEKEVGDLTPDEKERSLNNSRYLQISELLKNHSGYMFPFVKFYFEQKVPIKAPANSEVEGNDEILSLSQLLDVIKTKKYIIQQLSKPIEKWASEEPVNGISGFERLSDEIRNIEREKNAKWFINDLPKALRDQYRGLTNEEKSRTVTLAIQLEELGKPAMDRFFAKIKSMERWKMREVIDYLGKYIGGFSNLDMKNKISSLEKLEPQAGILYLDDQYLVMSMRTEKAQKELCSVGNWCINRGRFHSYADKGLQINIFNFGTDPSDPLFLTGTTISFAGNITDSHDINDNPIVRDRKMSVHLEKLGYPKSLIDAVDDSLPEEFAIKKALSIIYSEPSPRDTIYSLLSMSNELLSKGVSEEIWNSVAGLVAEIIWDNNKFNKKDFMDIYNDVGIFTKASWNVFDAIIGNDYTMDEIAGIKKITDDLVAIMKHYLEEAANGEIDATSKSVLAMKKIVAGADKNEEEFKKRMQN